MSSCGVLLCHASTKGSLWIQVLHLFKIRSKNEIYPGLFITIDHSLADRGAGRNVGAVGHDNLL